MTPRALIVVAAALSALTWPVASAAQVPELDFVAPEEIALTASDGESSKRSVWVRSSGTTQDVTPSFTVSLENGDGDAVTRGELDVVLIDDDDKEIAPDALTPLGANSVGRYRFFLRGSGMGDDVAGQLIATANGVAPGSLELSVGPKSVTNRGVDAALLIPLAAALILIIVVWGIVRPPLRRPLGTLDLDFKASFASTLTAIGALLGTVISASVLPEDTVNLSKDAFVALNLLFGVAVVVAGLFYSAMQKAIWVDKEGDATKQVRKLQGYVGPFLLACLITVWAVFGELWTLGLLVDELGQDGGFTEFAILVFKIMLGASAIAMVFYTAWRIHSIVEGERSTPAGPAGALPEPSEAPRPISLL